MKINIFGVPSCAGALYYGTEQTPEAIRRAGLVDNLKKYGFEVYDHGDIDNYSNLPRHNIAPVRNWPAPRIVWDGIIDKAEEIFDDHAFTILLGGDCSIEVGSFSAFRRVYGEDSHLLVLDGHVDLMAPKGDRCIGAAGMGLWFLTQDNFTWWNEEKSVDAINISVIGVQDIPEDCKGIKVIGLEDIKADSALNCVSEYLASIPQNASILLHFDVDILNEVIMPAAYSPSKNGLDYTEATNLFKLILGDSRIKGIEITEFDPRKDSDKGSAAVTIINLICQLKNTNLD